MDKALISEDVEKGRTPTASAKELGAHQLGRIWHDGAIAPLVYRSLAAQLAELPRQTRLDVGAKLIASCDPNGEGAARNEPGNKQWLARALLQLDDPALDATPPRPLIGINLYAPLRTILRAVERLVRDLKKSEGISERRPRPDKLDQYLRAWDLREGWTGNGYEVSAEKSFAEIAVETRSASSTVANRYASAFRLICGHAHTFENWFHLFAVMKLSGQYGPACLSRRRVQSGRRKASRVKVVPESTLTSAQRDARTGPIGNAAVLHSFADVDAIDTAEAIWRLIGEGASDEDILRRIEPDRPEQMRGVIRYLRIRHKDGRSLPRSLHE